MFFDLCRQIYIDSARIKCRRMGSAEHVRIFVISAGYIDQIDFIVHHFCHFDTIRKSKSALGQIVSGKADLDREPRSHTLTHCIQRHRKKTSPVLKTSAEFIGSPVEHRR